MLKKIYDYICCPRKKTVKVNFKNFWRGFDYRDHFGFLLSHYNFKISEKPDFIIYSCFKNDGSKGFEELDFKGVRIFYTGENCRPDMNKCEYAFSFCHRDDIKSDRHFRLPNYSLRLWKSGFNSEVLLKKIDNSQINWKDKHFCNFVYSNSNCLERNEIFHLLSKYKKVDSAGRLFNNMCSILPGGKNGVDSKLKFIKDYKFTIAFENESTPGYTTEKIVEAVLANTIPIYWGNPEIYKDFNTERFINYYDCDCSFEKLVERVIEADTSDDLYYKYLNQPFLRRNELTQWLRKDYAVSCFSKIFE